MEKAGISYSYFDGGAPEVGPPPLILIHGAGGTRLNWPPEIRRLKGIQVYALDLPGHGDSPSGAMGSVSGFARRILDWMDEENLPRAVLAGHSMGGAITQTIALMAPERVAGIVLVSTGARLRVHPQILDLSSDREQFHSVAELVTSWSFSEGCEDRLRELALERYREGDPEVMHSDFHACNNFDIMEEVEDIHTPTLVICGEEDRMTPVKYSNYLAERIEGAELVRISGAGHMVMLEKPKEVSKAIKEFMMGVVGRQ